MDINGQDETFKGSPEKRQSKFLGILRIAALIAAAAGAVGSVVLTLRAGSNTPRLLLVLFVIWVLSPFVALAWANLVSKRWSVITRVTLDCTTLLITLLSLAVYAELISPPAGSSDAFAWVVTPPASWLLMVIVVAAAALISRRLSHRGTGA